MISNYKTFQIYYDHTDHTKVRSSAIFVNIREVMPTTKTYRMTCHTLAKHVKAITVMVKLPRQESNVVKN